MVLLNLFLLESNNWTFQIKFEENTKKASSFLNFETTPKADA